MQSVHELAVGRETVQITHNDESQRFTITHEKFSFEVGYRTMFRSHVISEGVEKACDDWIMRKRSGWAPFLFSSPKARYALIEFLQRLADPNG